MYCFMLYLYRHLRRTRVSHHHPFLPTTKDITIMVTTMVQAMTTAINNPLAIEV